MPEREDALADARRFLRQSRGTSEVLVCMWTSMTSTSGSPRTTSASINAPRLSSRDRQSVVHRSGAASLVKHNTDVLRVAQRAPVGEEVAFAADDETRAVAGGAAFEVGHDEDDGRGAFFETAIRGAITMISPRSEGMQIRPARRARLEAGGFGALA
jgi:hypothetical protein